jgi:hypothetical protein
VSRETEETAIEAERNRVVLRAVAVGTRLRPERLQARSAVARRTDGAPIATRPGAVVL